MQNVFHYENGLMSAIARIADAVTLSVFWVICSLPVFTIGASSSAFYYAYTKCIYQKQGYAWKTFFSSFKSNFKQATQVWLIVLISAVILVADCYLLSLMQLGGALITVLQMLFTILLLAGSIWGLYLFPYLSRFENPNKRAMKNAALIALANAPRSILLLLLFGVCAIGFVFLPLLNLFIPAVYMFFANKILESTFQKYMRPEDLAAQIAAEQEAGVS